MQVVLYLNTYIFLIIIKHKIPNKNYDLCVSYTTENYLICSSYISEGQLSC